MLTAALFSLLAASTPVVGTGTAISTQDIDPPIRVWLNKRDARMGEEVSAYIEALADGYVVVLHAEPDGRVRVLFPLDPRYDNYVRGEDEIEVRGRGDRRAFRVYAAEGTGQVLAAYSRDPFRFDGLVRGDHWDYSIPGLWRVGDDPEADLMDIVYQMASGSYFDYDLVGYEVFRAYAYGGSSRVSVGLHLGSSWPYGFGYRYGYRCSRWGLHVGAFWYNSGCYDPFYYGAYYDPFYYDPFYYDPFFYDPFYYRSFYYRPYYYGTRVIYTGGVRTGRGRLLERYTFKSTDERFRVTDTRQRFRTVNASATVRRAPTVASGRVRVSPSRQDELSTRRRLSPITNQSVTDRREAPLTGDRRTVSGQGERQWTRRQMDTGQNDRSVRTPPDRRRTPTVRTPPQGDRSDPQATSPTRRRTPVDNPRSSDSNAGNRRIVKPQPGDDNAARRSVPQRIEPRRKPSQSRVVTPSRPNRATVERSGVRTSRSSPSAPSRSARPSTSSSRRPAARPSTGSRRPAASPRSSSSRRPTARPSTSSRHPAASPRSSSSRRPAARPSTSSSRRPAASPRSSSSRRPAARPSSGSSSSRGSVSRSSGSSGRASPSRSSGSRRRP